MKLTILASGSRANSAVLTHGNLNVMIDAGPSCGQLEARIMRAGMRPEDMSAILLTHDHADHATGAVRFSTKYRSPIYASTLTAEALRKRGLDESLWRVFSTGQDFMVKNSGLWVETFEVWHDAAEPVGFKICDLSAPEEQLVFATDLGKVHQAMAIKCRDATTIFLEANYAKAMLEVDKTRPWSVRERIQSHNGHLSNEGAASAVAALPELRKVILGHLSAATNHPDVALATVRTALAGRVPEVDVQVAFIPECDRCKPPLQFEIL